MNVTALVDESDGAVVERYMYDPYGKVSVRHGVRDAAGNNTSESEWDERTSNTFDNAILYCGYRFDPESGLYHVCHRSYHPTLGRWVQRDPIGYVDGMSLYEYGQSAPTSATDPHGLFVNPEQIASGQEVQATAADAQSDADGVFHSYLWAMHYIEWLGGPTLSPLEKTLLNNLFRGGYVAYGFSAGVVSTGPGNRFVYTCKGGWVDMGHYTGMTVATYVTNRAVATKIAYGIERFQTAAIGFQHVPGLKWILEDSAQSAFTSEDLFSDFLGIEAGIDMQYTALSGLLFDFPRRIQADLQRELRSVNPENDALGGEKAGHWLELGAPASKTMVFSPEARKMPYHRCVCDEEDEPIGADGKW